MNSIESLASVVACIHTFDCMVSPNLIRQARGELKEGKGKKNERKRKETKFHKSQKAEERVAGLR